MLCRLPKTHYPSPETQNPRPNANYLLPTTKVINMSYNNRILTIVALVGGLLAVLAGSSLSNVFLIAFSSIMFTASIVVWRYGYLIVPLITKATNIVEIRNGHEVAPTRDYIIKKAESGYYATKFLEIKFYESTMDKEEGQKNMLFESFEKAISSLKYIVKISLLISAIDLSRHIDEIKTKRSTAESKKAKYLRESSEEIVRLDREIAMWNRLLDRITHGERPIEIIAFASTTAFGLTKEEAVSKVRRQSKEIKTILSSSLGSDVAELVDKDMLRCFEWELFFPTSHEELRDEVF